MFESLANLFNSDTFFQLLELWTKSSLILAVAFVATWCARKASASMRAIIWLSTIFALILLPVATWLGPDYSVSIDLPVAGHDQVPSVTAPLLQDQVIPSKAVFPLAENQVQASEILSSLPAATSSTIQLPVHSLLLSVWLLGMLAVTMWLARGHHFVYRLLSMSRVIDDPPILAKARQIAEHYGLAGPIAIRASAQIKIPLVCGLSKPTVLLPEKAWRSWSDERREMVLLHEFAHIARRDVPMRALAHALLPFHWFNPLLWVAINRLSWEQERACDDLVLGAGAKPSLYAKTLLTFAQNGHGPLLMSATQLTGTTVKNRILSVLSPDVQRRPIRRLGMVTIFSTVLTILMPFAITSVIAAERDEATPIHIAADVDVDWDEADFEDDKPEQALTQAETEEAIAQLSSSEPHEIAKAAINLRHAKAPQAIPLLLEVLADDRTVPGEWLQPHFSRFNNPTTPGREAAVTLAKMGKDAQSKLMQAIHDNNFVVRANAAFGLGLARNADAIPLLLEALKDRQARVRAESAWSLGMIRNSVAVTALNQALTDENAKVREQSAWALGMIRDPSAVEALALVMEDPESQVRSQTAWALGMIRADEAVPVLVEALSDDQVEVGRQAAWALGMVRSDTAVAGLAQALTSSDLEIRSQASWALGMIRSPEAADSLTHALADEHEEVRKQAAWALGMIRHEAGIDGLVVALRDEHADVRSQASWALGMIRGKAAIEGLAKVLDDSNADVRAQAAWALGMIRGQDAITGLTRALDDSSENVRAQAAWALGMIRGSAGVPQLIEALEDSQAEVRSQAAWALGMIRDQRAVAALKKARQDQADSVREQADWALDMIGIGQEIEL